MRSRRRKPGQGVIYIAIAQGRHDDARELADERLATAESADARTIAGQLTETRRQI